jgi:Spy/CpxP family protein refolding chaperone
MFPKFKHVLAATMVLAVVPFAALAGPVKAANAAHHEGKGRGGHHGGMGGFGFFGPMAKDLNLTDAQKAQMKAIAQKHRGTAQKGDRKAQRDQLRALLSAPKVDGAALRNFLNARAAEMEANAGHRAAMMTEMRAILTPDQRAKLVKSLNAARPDGKQAGKDGAKSAERFEGKRKAMRDKLTADLKLTPAQQSAFDALQAKVMANHADPANRQAGRAALARFVETGDAAAFQSTMKAQRQGKLPVNELVAVAESLTQAQRQKLLPRLERFAQMGGGMQGGHGRHGGKGDKGGRGHH